MFVVEIITGLTLIIVSVAATLWVADQVHSYNEMQADCFQIGSFSDL